MFKKLRSPAINSIAAGILQKSIPFIASLYVARTIGQENFAAFAFSINTANTITAFSALGLAPAILTTLGARRPDENVNDKIAAIFFISALICFFAMIIGLLSGFITLNAIRESKGFAGVAFLAPALILLQTAQSTYQATGQHRAFFLQSCTLFIVVGLTLTLVSAIRADSALFSNAYSTAFLIVGVASSIKLLVTLKGSLKFNIFHIKSELRPIIFSQLPFAGYSALWMVSIYLCNLHIASEYSSSDLAYYNVGFQWYSLMLLVPATLGGVLIPHFAAMNNSVSARKQIFRLSLLFTVIACPLTLFMHLIAPWLLHIYGMSSSNHGLATVRYLIFAGGISFSLTPLLQQFMALRRFRILISISVCWSLVALIGTYFFSTGSEGVALSFLFAYCVVAVLVISISIFMIEKRPELYYD